MNLYETQALRNFLEQLVQAGGVQKDPQAAALIAEAVSRQPDAAYLLVQRSMLLDQALANAKAQIAELQSAVQAGQPGASGGFLNPANVWGNSAQRLAPQGQAPQGQAPQGQASQPSPVQYQPQQQNLAPAAPYRAAPGFLGGGMGGMLGTMAATAAGVAGGAFLFRGIENMLHPQGAGDQAGHAAPAQSGLGDIGESATQSGQTAFADMVPSEQALATPDTMMDIDASGFGDEGDLA